MSWSFRKDCIGFARSFMEPSSEAKRKDLNDNEDEEETLNYLLCVLIGYFVSTVSHDADEWLTWGVPYVDICVGALKLEPTLTEKIRDRFMGTVGRGYLFVFEDEEGDDEEGRKGRGDANEGWTHVTPLPAFLSSLADKLAVFEREEGGVQAVLDGFLAAMQATVAHAKYDTRTRVLISRRICHMFQLQSEKHQQQEMLEYEIAGGLSTSHAHTTSTIDSSDRPPPHNETETSSSKLETFQKALLSNLSAPATLPPPPATAFSYTSYFSKSDAARSPERALAIPAFRTTVQPQQVASAVNSFRALKVGMAAASGGALMFCAGGLAAPSILASLASSLASMTGASTTSVMMLDLAVLLNTYGLPVITSAATTLGTTMASWKMLRRTDHLKEFILEPLHAPHTRDLSRNTILVASPDGYLKDSPDDVDGSMIATLALFRRLISPSSTTTTTTTTTPNKIKTPPSQIHVLPPPDVVYLLIPGHFSGNLDLKDIWGGDTDLHPDDDAREGAGGGDNFRFTCRPVSASKLNKGADEAAIVPSDAPARSNVKQGWWRDLASGVVEEGSGERGSHGGGEASTSLGTGGEPYIVRWDTVELTRLFKAQQTFLLEKSVTVAIEEVLKFASPIIGAAALPLTVLERATELDCPWLVVMDRAEQAGRLLAALLLENATSPQLASDTEHKQYRQRSVSLVGYGFGARVIVHCLLLLAAAPNHAGLGIVQDVVLIGAPVSSGSFEWLQIRRVVAGRLVNCFKRDDWMLGLMYRSKSWEVGVAGLGPVHLSGSPSNTDEDIDYDTAGRRQTGITTASTQQTKLNHVATASSKESSSGDGSQCDSTSGISCLESHSKAKPLIQLLKHNPAWRTEVENVDVGDLVPSHLLYADCLRAILRRVGLPTPGE